MRTFGNHDLVLAALGVAALMLVASPAQAQRISLSDLLARIVALEGTVAQLQTDLAQETADRQAADAALQALIDALPTDSLPALQARVSQLEADSVPGLADHVEVIDRFRDIDRDGIDDPVPTVLFEGANVQIVNGNSASDTRRANGLGNLIVGYDEPRTAYGQSADPICSGGGIDNQADCEAIGLVWAVEHKSGSHNVIVGFSHAYSSSAGVVFGSANVNTGQGATVTGGRNNHAQTIDSSVSGGAENTASGIQSSVSGGSRNVASGRQSSISGGGSNTAGGEYSSISGGAGNTASGYRSSVSGGGANTASGIQSSVSGGNSNTANGGNASVSGGAENTADGGFSSVSGGWLRAAPGPYDWAGGSLFETD